MTLAAAPEALQGAVAAGILGCGSVVLGLGRSGRPFLRGDRAPGRRRSLARGGGDRGHQDLSSGSPCDSRYGHPLHKSSDPRATRLIDIATDAGCAGRHIEIARLAEKLLPALVGKPLTLNVSGAHTRGAAGCRLSGGRAEGDSRFWRARRVSSRTCWRSRSGPSGSCCRTPPGRRSTMTARRRPDSVPAKSDGLQGEEHAIVGRRVEWDADRGAGHLHHRALRRHDAGGPGRGCHQDRKPRGDPYRSLSGRAVLAAFPGLQPQQAQSRAGSEERRRSCAVR